MSRITLVLLVYLYGVQAAVAADDSPALTFSALKEGYEREMNRYREEVFKEYQNRIAEIEKQRKAVKPGEKGSGAMGIPALKMVSGGSGPGGAYSSRFLAYAKANPKASDAVDALAYAYRSCDGPNGAPRTHTSIMKALEDQFATNDGIGNFVRHLGRESDPATLSALKAVLERNPEPKLRAIACKTLVSCYDSELAAAKRIANDERAKKLFEANFGKERVARLLTGTNELEAEATKYKQLFASRFADVLPNLSIGSPAPEVVSRDVDGKVVRLSDLKGRVIVLDIWATWCGPCKAMIPHERAMVERLKDKPFTLVSISADEELKTLKDFLAKEKMPWNHWWNGSTGGLIDAWDIQYYPTIYVIDAKGVIRHKDLREKALEEAVNNLLAEKP